MSKNLMTSKSPAVIPAELIEKRIYVIRAQKVILDSDLAELYGVPTMRLNVQVKRNIDRFPADFMFRLTTEEAKLADLSQIAIGSRKCHVSQLPPPKSSCFW